MGSIMEYMHLRIITKSTSVNKFICYVNNLNIFQIVFYNSDSSFSINFNKK